MMALTALTTLLSRFTIGNAGKGFKKALVPMLFVQKTMSSQPPTVHSQTITKNLELHPSWDVSGDHKPLAVIFSWLLSKKKHVNKFGDFYKRQGFDVLTVSISPMQLMWPVSGSQVIAEDVLKFLIEKDHYQNVVVHGFSVGGYVYGELLVKMRANPSKYNSIKSRIVGQVFDSVADFDRIAVGVSRAVTRNIVLQKSIEAYLRSHLLMFYGVATKHYITASRLFHENIVKAPSLLLFSKNDPVGTPDGHLRVMKCWEDLGMQVYAKCWERSRHVSHFQLYPEEYMKELAAFLDKIGLLTVPLEDIKNIHRASKL